MKLLIPFVIALLSNPVAATEPSAVTTTSATYVEALGVENGFLHAWVNRDANTGLTLMSPTLRQPPRGNESWLRLYVQGISNPHHQAFELQRGELIANRAVFPVTLYELYSGESTANSYASSIELVREGESWHVSKLPKSSDNE